jgi:hypothetical protein
MVGISADESILIFFNGFFDNIGVVAPKTLDILFYIALEIYHSSFISRILLKPFG